MKTKEYKQRHQGMQEVIVEFTKFLRPLNDMQLDLVRSYILIWFQLNERTEEMQRIDRSYIVQVGRKELSWDEYLKSTELISHEWNELMEEKRRIVLELENRFDYFRNVMVWMDYCGLLLDYFDWMVRIKNKGGILCEND